MNKNNYETDFKNNEVFFGLLFFFIFKRDLSPSMGFRFVNSLDPSGTLINICMSYRGLHKM